MFLKLLRLLFARKVRTDAPATLQAETPERHPVAIEKLIERYPLESAADPRVRSWRDVQESYPNNCGDPYCPYCGGYGLG